MNLYQHQSDALNRVKGFQNVAFYHDMGFGYICCLRDMANAVIDAIWQLGGK